MKKLPKTVASRTIDLECCGTFKLEEDQTYYDDDGTTVFDAYIEAGIVDESLVRVCPSLFGCGLPKRLVISFSITEISKCRTDREFPRPQRRHAPSAEMKGRVRADTEAFPAAIVRRLSPPIPAVRPTVASRPNLKFNVWPAPSARGLSRSAADQSASTYPVSEARPSVKMEIRAPRSSQTEWP